MSKSPGAQLHQERRCNMPHSVPVSKLMIPRNEWPQLRAETTVGAAIKVLRIVNEDKMLEHGHSTPLVLDDNYDLLGFVHLSDLLKSVRPFCLQPDRPCELDKATTPIRDFGRTLCGNSGRERQYRESPGHHDGPLRVPGAGDGRGKAEGACPAFRYIQHRCHFAV